jgi:hypothetical protein
VSEAFERPGLVAWGSVSVMATRAEDLRREALALSDVERADLAAELLVSLEAPAEQDASVTESEWAEEIERRARRVLAGDVDTQPWSTVRQRVADTLDG